MELIVLIAVMFMSYKIGHRIGWDAGHDEAEGAFWKAQLKLAAQQGEQLKHRVKS